MTTWPVPDIIDNDGGIAQTVREVERLTRDATTDRPPLVVPVDVAAQTNHVLTYVSRPGDEVHVRDLEALLDRPVRARGTYTVYDADSFVTVVGRQPGQGETTLWAQQPSTGAAKPSITAIFNDHTADETVVGWRDHRAVLEVRPDPDWLQWEARDAGAPEVGARRWMDQVTFAEFVIDQTQNIAGASELYHAATTFESHRSMQVQSVVNLDDGTQQMQYTEQLANGREGAGVVSLPTELSVNLRPFYGAEPVTLKVLLRHRVSKEGGLKFGLFRHRPDLVIEGAWGTWCREIGERLADLPLLQGNPPAPIVARPVRTDGPTISTG